MNETENLNTLLDRFILMAEVRRKLAMDKRGEKAAQDRPLTKDTYAVICGLESAADAYRRCARELERTIHGEEPPAPGDEWHDHEDSDLTHNGQVQATDARSAAGRVEPLVGRRVVCAANRRVDADLQLWLLLGPRHWGPQMRATAQLLPFDAHAVGWEDGFIDQRGAFMDRREAWKVAEAAGQIIARCGGDTKDGGTLFSENLY